MTNSTASQRNPYVIGRPLNEPQLFFGREGLFRFIKDNLSQNEQVILLHGQRRIGKSSIILNISNFVAPDKFVFVSFDLEHYSREPLGGVLSALAKAIIEQLNLSSDKITLPSITELKTKRDVFHSQFLPQVYEALGDKKLVLLLDEFDALRNDYSDSLIEHFFLYLRSTIKLHDKLFIILFVGRQSTVRPNLLSLFKGAPYEEIGLLDELSAKRLITEPAKGILEYDPEALKAILELSARHPYFTQVICFALFGRARERENWKVSREDVKGIIDKAIENAEAGLAWFWDGLSEPEQVVFSAVAEAQRKMEQDQGFPEDPLVLLKSYGVIQTDPLAQAAKQLVDTSFLDNTGRRVKIEFVRRWLVQRHPLQQEIRNLKKLEQQQVNPIKPITATPPPQQGEKQNQSYPDEQVLKSSPNHVSRPNRETRLPKLKLILLGNMVAIVAAITALVSTGIDRQWRTTVPEGNQKMAVVSCIADANRISYGECTFFANPNIPKEDRKLGIEAFKKKEYPKAAEIFKNAVNNNHKDPEVLIYYNNALARQKVSPLTLAVIVPVPAQNPELSLKAQEILRGVAQAQDQFNKNNGFNSRLLQIAIANDADQSDQAEQVAAELVKDKDVLGVIGHYSSQATQKALPKYEQAGLPIISPGSTSTELKSNVFFRAAPSDKASGEKLADYAAQDLKIKKVVIFNNPDIYSKSIQKTFTDEFKSKGGQVVREIALTEKLDAKTEVENSLKDQAQAAVLFPDAQHTSVALKIAKANAEWMKNPQNLNKPGLKLLGGDALYGNTTLSEGKEAVKDMILVVPWFRDEPKSKGFAQKAEKQWQGSVSWLTAAGFDATQAFITALLSSSKPSRLSVLQGLPKVDLPDKQTSGEPLKFNQDGERQKSKPIIVKVEKVEEGRRQEAEGRRNKSEGDSDPS